MARFNWLVFLLKTIVEEMRRKEGEVVSSQVEKVEKKVGETNFLEKKSWSRQKVR